MSVAPAVQAKRNAILRPGWPVVFPTIVLTPSELFGGSLCFTTIADGRLPNVTRSVTIENFWTPREIFPHCSPQLAVRRQPSFTRWAPPNSGGLLLWRNLYNKGSSIQGSALRARREMHWRREAVRWGSP